MEKKLSHEQQESHEKRSAKRWDRVTKKTNYKNADGKTMSSSGREDLFWSQAGDTPSQRKAKRIAHMSKKMGKKPGMTKEQMEHVKSGNLGGFMKTYMK